MPNDENEMYVLFMPCYVRMDGVRLSRANRLGFLMRRIGWAIGDEREAYLPPRKRKWAREVGGDCSTV